MDRGSTPRTSTITAARHHLQHSADPCGVFAYVPASALPLSNAIITHPPAFEHIFAVTPKGSIARGSLPLKLCKNPKVTDFAVSFGFWWKMWKQYRTRCLLLAEFRSYWRLSLSEFLACRVCLSKASIQLCIMTRRDTLRQYRNRRKIPAEIPTSFLT